MPKRKKKVETEQEAEERLTRAVRRFFGEDEFGVGIEYEEFELTATTKGWTPSRRD